MKHDKKIITLNLDLATTNEFKILAINEGDLAPNTAKIILHDSNRTFELFTSFKKNESAFITFIQKE